MANNIQQLVFEKLIKQAGVDFESKPILVFYSCYLPDPQQNNYDELLKQILVRLDSFVESDYVLVLFSAPAIHKPSWSWLMKAYMSLGRKYRKNLKNLYIVHPNTFTKLLMQTMGTLISPKFAKKLVWVPNLAKLAALIPIRQIAIPDLIHQVNDHVEAEAEKGGFLSNLFGIHGQDSKKWKSLSSLSTSKPGKCNVFGISLETLMGSNSEKGIPRVIVESCEYIRLNGITTEGIFRRSPASNLLHRAKAAYERNDPKIQFDDYGGVHVPCVLLKMFFREMPDALFTKDMYQVFKSMEVSKTDHEKINYIKTRIFPMLSANGFNLLKYVCKLLHQVHLQSEVNKMTANNLAIVWAPNLVRSDDVALDFEMCATGGGSAGNVIRLCIEYYPKVFSS